MYAIVMCMLLSCVCYCHVYVTVMCMLLSCVCQVDIAVLCIYTIVYVTGAECVRRLTSDVRRLTGASGRLTLSSVLFDIPFSALNCN